MEAAEFLRQSEIQKMKGLDKKALIIEMHQLGLKTMEIIRRTGYKKSTVYDVVKRFKKFKSQQTMAKYQHPVTVRNTPEKREVNEVVMERSPSPKTSANWLLSSVDPDLNEVFFSSYDSHIYINMPIDEEKNSENPLEENAQMMMDEKKKRRKPAVSVKRKFFCNICKKLFHHKGDFNKHLRIHTGEKPFQCDKCNMKFSNTSNLHRHGRSHDTKGDKFFCLFCLNTFPRSDSLKNHLMTHKSSE